jgi:hypothetical protein
VIEYLRYKLTWVYLRLSNTPGSCVIGSTQRERKVNVKDKSH